MAENGITFTQLVAYASGELDAADAAIVESYLAGAPYAPHKLAKLREAIEIMRRDRARPPSPQAVRRARSLWAERNAGTVLEWLRGAERIVAEVVFDSRRRLAVPGFRGAASTHQLAYECAQGRVDLQILPRSRPQGEAWRLRGQLSGVSGPTVGSAALVAGGTLESVADTVPDQYGRFKIDSPPGVYDLMIELDHGRQVIVAPGLAIGTHIE